MQDLKMAEKLIRAWRFLDVPHKIGIFGDENVFTNAQDDIADALLILAGEDKMDFEHSTTRMVLFSYMEPASAAKVLLRKEDAQPAPSFVTKEQVRDMVKRAGGYFYE